MQPSGIAGFGGYMNRDNVFRPVGNVEKRKFKWTLRVVIMDKQDVLVRCYSICM